MQQQVVEKRNVKMASLNRQQSMRSDNVGRQQCGKTVQMIVQPGLLDGADSNPLPLLNYVQNAPPMAPYPDASNNGKQGRQPPFAPHNLVPPPQKQT